MRRKIVIVTSGILLGALCWNFWYFFRPATPIADLITNPDRFNGDTVTIAGTVESRIAMWDHHSYTLRDETGEIRVFTDVLPPLGRHRRVRGRVDVRLDLSLPILGKARWIVLVEKQ